MLNLDTHILIHHLLGDLSDAERKAIESAKSFCISDIVLWELCKLVQKKRLKIELNRPEVKALIESLKIFPISFAIAEQSCRLDFKSDPADEIIAATSIVHKIPLLTRDARIRKSKMITFAGNAANE